MDGVGLGVLEALDVGGAGPAQLLQDPADERGGRVGEGEGGGEEGDLVVLEEEERCQVAVLVDDLGWR